MSEPFLYLEDLIKAEVPKPPKEIGGGAKAPGARMTLAGGPKATPKVSDKAQALASGPAKDIGGGVAPPAQQTLAQKNPNPAPLPAAKAAATQTYEYWSGDGAPPSSGGWEKGPEGGWRRPEGSGSGGNSEADHLIADMKPAEPEDPATAQKQAQEPDKKLVSSGDQESAPVSSSAEKIEQAKQGDIGKELEDRAALNETGHFRDNPDVGQRAFKEEHRLPKDDKGRVKYFEDFPGWSREKHEATAREALANKDYATAADHIIASKQTGEPQRSREESDAAGDIAAEFTKKTGGIRPMQHRATRQRKEAKKVAADAHAKSEKKIRAEAEKQLKEEAKSAAGEGEKPKKPNQEQIDKMAQKLTMEADNHRQSARNMLENVQAHAERETDPEKKEQLEKIAGYLEEQSNIEGEIGNQDKDILKMAQQAVKHHGVNKPPKDEEPKEQVSNKPKYNYGAAFDAGRTFGEQVGGAAATLEGGGAFVPTVVNYGGSGAVRGGHHLLQGNDKKAATEAAPKKAPAKGAEVEQSSMKTEKSLPLYLDLDILKAVNAPNVGHTTPSESRARIKHESSYAKRPVGVANEGIVTEDDPDEGKEWKHDDADAVETSVDQKLKEKKKDEEETEEETEKALLADPSSLLKSLNTEVRSELNKVLPSDMETAFMVDVLQYDPALVSKGQKHIMGRDRHLFNEWMQGRLSKSISSLTERIVIK